MAMKPPLSKDLLEWLKKKDINIGSALDVLKMVRSIVQGAHLKK